MESALRILHIVDAMNYSGIPTLLMNLYRKTDRKKIQFDFLTSGNGTYDNEIKQLGGHLYQIPPIEEIGFFQYTRTLRKFFKLHSSYIIVHSHLNYLNTITLREAKKVRIPVRIAHMYSLVPNQYETRRLRHQLCKHTLPLYATEYFVSSKDAIHQVFHKSKDPDLFPYIIELENFCYSPSTREIYRKKLNVTEKQFVIGHVGGFTSQKNHSYIIDLFRAFRRTVPHAKLVLIGEGPLKKTIEQKLNQYQLQNDVYLLGAVDDVENWIQAFDVFVFPSIQEGLPVSVLEAECAGLPILISENIKVGVNFETGSIMSLPLENKQEWLSALHKVNVERPRLSITKDTIIQKGLSDISIVRKTEEKYLYLRDEGI
jgi:glycosyltransferase involved in cell wall biosynthesis